MERVNLDGNPIPPITICMIGGGGFIGSHLCEKLMSETSHKAIVVDVSSEKINHLLDKSLPCANRIEFHQMNIKNDSRLETLVKAADLVLFLHFPIFLLHFYLFIVFDNFIFIVDD
jgi:UDP-apiose/xylose synthase